MEAHLLPLDSPHIWSILPLCPFSYHTWLLDESILSSFHSPHHWAIGPTFPCSFHSYPLMAYWTCPQNPLWHCSLPVLTYSSLTFSQTLIFTVRGHSIPSLYPNSSPNFLSTLNLSSILWPPNLITLSLTSPLAPIWHRKPSDYCIPDSYLLPVTSHTPSLLRPRYWIPKHSPFYLWILLPIWSQLCWMCQHLSTFNLPLGSPLSICPPSTSVFHCYLIPC